MKKLLLATGLTALMGTTAAAQEIGATFSRFDDNWLTVLRTGMVEYAGTIDGYPTSKKMPLMIWPSKLTRCVTSWPLV